MPSSRALLLGFLVSTACSKATPPADEPSGPVAAEAPLPPASASPSPSASPEVAAAPSASAAEPGLARSAGAPAPKWTGIDGVRDCTGQILGSYVCTPHKRPDKCETQAWGELTSLAGKDALTPCALEPDLMLCSVERPGDPGGRCFAGQRPAKCTDDKWARVKDTKLVYSCDNK